MNRIFRSLILLLPRGPGSLVRVVLLVCVLAIATKAYAQQPGGWSVTGSLGTARHDGHTATLLKNGKVLVVGGVNVRNPCCDSTGSAELYDPATGQWSATGSMNTPRSYHVAVRLDDGRVLVTGGNRSTTLTFLSSAEIYDPDTGAWSSAGNTSVARAGHNATLLADGKVLVMGGEVLESGRWFNYKSAELFDPLTREWSSAGTMNSAHAHFTAVLLANGKVLVVSGWSDVSSAMYLQRSTELYDPTTRSWTAAGDLITPRSNPTATLLPNGKVLIVGGGDDDIYGLDTAELYDPTTGQWTATGRLNAGRAWHTATLLPNGKVLVAGGYVNSGARLNSAELYDPATGSWSVTGSLNTERAWHTATLLPNGHVLVVGGRIPSEASSKSAELYGAEVPSLTMNSTSYCIGDPWNLKVNSITPSAWIRLVGTSNGKSWELRDWRKTDDNGRVSETATFDSSTEGTHTLYVDVAGKFSNAVSFNVARCQITFALNSTEYCVGDSWSLRVDSDFPNASMNLSGTVNGEPWEIPNWRRARTDGTFTEAGTFVPGSEGAHTMRVRIGTAQSNVFFFRVSRCGP